MEPVRYVVETGSADGIIISRTQPDDPRVRYMLERGFPFATHGRTEMGIDHPFHDFDNHAFALKRCGELAALGRRKLALLAPPPILTYHHHTRQRLLGGLLETGWRTFPSTPVNIDNDRPDPRADRAADASPEPIRTVSSAGPAPPTLAVVAGIEDAGLTCSAATSMSCRNNRRRCCTCSGRRCLVVNEDFRLAGRELARSVLGWIDGDDPRTLQSLSVPDRVVAPEQQAALAGA